MRVLLVTHILFLSLCCLNPAVEAFAARTAVDVSAAAGDGDTTAYGLHARQTYESWFAGDVGELKPTLMAGGFAWVGEDDTVWGVDAAPGLMFSFYTDADIRPFIAAASGGALISDKKIESRELGTTFQFRSTGSVGVEFGESLSHRIQADFTHYSNLGFNHFNDGYDTYGFTYGYSF